MKIIISKNAPNPIGPYSQGIQARHLVFCSGQIGVDPKTGHLAMGVKGQTKQAIENLKAVIEQAGSRLEKVVKITIFLKNVDDFKEVNEAYSEYFHAHKPARSTVEVSNLPGKQALIEIDAIAVTI